MPEAKEIDGFSQFGLQKLHTLFWAACVVEDCVANPQAHSFGRRGFRLLQDFRRRPDMV
jgi:hypothetical protein